MPHTRASYNDLPAELRWKILTELLVYPEPIRIVKKELPFYGLAETALDHKIHDSLDYYQELPKHEKGPEESNDSVSEPREVHGHANLSEDLAQLEKLYAEVDGPNLDTLGKEAGEHLKECDAIEIDRGGEIGISQLTSTQREALQSYISVTDRDLSGAIFALQQSEWHAPTAIVRFFNGIEVGRDLADPSNGSTATDSPHGSHDSDGSSYQATTETPAKNEEGAVQKGPVDESSSQDSPKLVAETESKPVGEVPRKSASKQGLTRAWELGPSCPITTGIFQASKLANREATRILYGMNTFHVEVVPSQILLLIKALSSDAKAALRLVSFARASICAPEDLKELSLISTAFMFLPNLDTVTLDLEDRLFTTRDTNQALPRNLKLAHFYLIDSLADLLTKNRLKKLRFLVERIWVEDERQAEPSLLKGKKAPRSIVGRVMSLKEHRRNLSAMHRGHWMDDNDKCIKLHWMSGHQSCSDKERKPNCKVKWYPDECPIYTIFDRNEAEGGEICISMVDKAAARAASKPRHRAWIHCGYPGTDSDHARLGQAYQVVQSCLTQLKLPAEWRDVQDAFARLGFDEHPTAQIAAITADVRAAADARKRCIEE